MYVALRQMMEQLESGEVKTLYPGDEVTTFKAWPYQNKVSAISFRLVAKAEAGVPADADTLLSRGPNLQVRADIMAEHGLDKRDFTPVQPAGWADMPMPYRNDWQPPAPTSVAGSFAAGEAAEELTVDTVANGCPDCAYVAANAAGLKIHRARLHKPLDAP